MALFEGLSEKLNHIFSKIVHKGRLTELEINTALREIRVALLEADVNFAVVKDFINNVKQKALGQEILESLTASQQVIKIVNEELIKLMGGSVARLEFTGNPAVIMMCGLQGAGKTTMCGKLAHLLKRQGRTVMLAACDVYRPAAIKQLEIVAKNADAQFFEQGVSDPVKIAKNAVKEAVKTACDVLILDTAGRLHINEELMRELEDIKKAVRPCEILLTVDAMTGQDAVTVASSFNEKLDITGVILTKLDGDTRGGAALSVRAVTGKPIKFCGIGEKIGDIEPFYPDRMASRILGMGDVLTLIEKAQAAVDEKQLKQMERRLAENSFTLEDFLIQFDSISKMGGLAQILSMMPGANKLNIKESDLDENLIKSFKAIIQSMTPEERANPAIIKSSRRQRIAKGSGTTIQQVNQLLKQYEQTKELMRKLKGKGGRLRLPF
ncbi:MAG TPA: signal recognition particle protein [Clostridia bacterium]